MKRIQSLLNEVLFIVFASDRKSNSILMIENLISNFLSPHIFGQNSVAPASNNENHHHLSRWRLRRSITPSFKIINESHYMCLKLKNIAIYLSIIAEKFSALFSVDREKSTEGCLIYDISKNQTRNDFHKII